MKMEKYLIKVVECGGICNKYYLYKDNSVYGNKDLDLVAMLLIEKTKSDNVTRYSKEEILDIISASLPNGTQGIFYIE